MIILAVSKDQPLEKIQKAIDLGQICFGENYLQGALPKIQALLNKSLEWHFIGKIQSNKTRDIATYFSCVQSLDDLKIAERLNNQRPSQLPPLQVCIEINNGRHPQKPGIPLSELPLFIEKLKALPRLHWRGLMSTITEEYETTAHAFVQLKKQGHDIDILSMGMSDDYQKAIELGATMIRIGTAFFGKRQGRKHHE
ncbi:MAG TPA: YggS family pyridoxal phosphate-dependent enzyme [Gammaproteobacteria bacterium]|nr:YggS family pyridoxal phosphate-dependent enzyme [Gammaproteobacteria bacterium]